LGILDLEPTDVEIHEACHLKFGDRYIDLQWEWSRPNRQARTDMEHAAEMELIQKKRLHAETKDAIVYV
jgi:hypothetical protein